MMLINDPLPPMMSQRMACYVLNLNRNTLRHTHKQSQFYGPVKPANRVRKNAPQPRALTETERLEVEAVLTSNAYCNQPPMQVYYDLLQQGQYLCSMSTMHRTLREENAGSNEHRNPMRYLVSQPHDLTKCGRGTLPNWRRKNGGSICHFMS